MHLKLTVACNPMFPPEDTKLHPLVLYCVGTIQDGDEPVGMITGIWFRMGLWEDMPDEDQPWYFAPFMAVSAETFVMADFIALSGPEIRRDVSRSDKLDIFFIDCVWVEPAHRGRGIARLPGRPGRIMSRLCRRIHVRCLGHPNGTRRRARNS